MQMSPLTNHSVFAVLTGEMGFCGCFAESKYLCIPAKGDKLVKISLFILYRKANRDHHVRHSNHNDDILSISILCYVLTMRWSCVFY